MISHDFSISSGYFLAISKALPRRGARDIDVKEEGQCGTGASVTKSSSCNNFCLGPKYQKNGYQLQLITSYNPIFNAHDKPMYNLYNWNTGHRCQWITRKNTFLVHKKNSYDMKIRGKGRWLCDTEPKMSFYGTETGFWTDFPVHGLWKCPTQYIE